MADPIVQFTPEMGSKVILEKMALIFKDKDPMFIEVPQSPEDTQKTNVMVKEGAEYQIQLTFRVEGQIVSGLRYHHEIIRKGITSEKSSQMVGSYGPKTEPYDVKLGEAYEMPKGMIFYGRYEVKSRFIDDDGLLRKEWEWSFDVGRDWDRRW